MSLWSSNPTTAFIGLGSNLGDRAGNLLLGVRGLIEANFVVHKLSCIYETEPNGLDTDLNFLNMVAEVQVKSVAASQMMARLLRIEYLLGRGDKEVRGPRTIDLDILFFGSEVLETDFLTVPHPRMHLRKFVLVPMNEVCPTFVHPTLKQDIATLLANSEDTSWVNRWDPNHGLLGEQACIDMETGDRSTETGDEVLDVV